MAQKVYYSDGVFEVTDEAVSAGVQTWPLSDIAHAETKSVLAPRFYRLARIYGALWACCIWVFVLIMYNEAGTAGGLHFPTPGDLTSTLRDPSNHLVVLVFVLPLIEALLLANPEYGGCIVSLLIGLGTLVCLTLISGYALGSNLNNLHIDGAWYLVVVEFLLLAAALLSTPIVYVSPRDWTFVARVRGTFGAADLLTSIDYDQVQHIVAAINAARHAVSNARQ